MYMLVSMAASNVKVPHIYFQLKSFLYFSPVAFVYRMTNGLLLSLSLSSMFVEMLLFSVVSVHGLRLMGCDGISVNFDVFESPYAALLVVAIGSLHDCC